MIEPLVARAAIRLIQVYRNTLSGYRLQSCRFWPTCSSYAQQALERHGLIKGSWMALRRLLRCHPLCEGGVDPVR